MDTIFLSSTCYDLADLRSILMDSLTAAGFSTIASDVTSSDFTLVPYKNSVETCETNVARSDLLLLILDRRYGPAIPDFGGKSATHIEYDTAVRCRIPVVTFIRRAFLNDHRIWHKMTSSGHSAAEVAKALGHVDTTQRKNSFEFVPLFALFDSVRRASERGKSNWVDSFDTAQEVSRLAPRRAREILHADAFLIQSSLRSIAASPSPVSLSAEYVTRAIASIGDLELTDTELYVLAQAALNHKVNSSLVVERMSEKQRTSFLTAFASKLIESDAGAAMMIRFKSPAIIDTIRAWLDSNHEFRPCVIAIQRLGFDVDFVTNGVRRMVHQVLWHTYDVAHLGFQENAEKLLEDKLSALTIIGHVGERSDLTAVFRCLLERGIPTVSGDPEHVSCDDPPGTINYRRQGVIVNAAKEVFRELHSRGTCLLTALS